jgi:hypothetical protein
VDAAQSSADLILLPYNYLIDPMLRESLTLHERLNGIALRVPVAINDLVFLHIFLFPLQTALF